MSSMAWCQKHFTGYRLDTGCLDCNAMEKRSSHHVKDDIDIDECWFPATLDEFNDFAIIDPFQTAVIMDKKFGYEWRNMNDAEVTNLVSEYYKNKIDDSGIIT